MQGCFSSPIVVYELPREQIRLKLKLAALKTQATLDAENKMPKLIIKKGGQVAFAR